MNVSEVYSRAVQHLSRIPPRSYIPLGMTLIPVMIQTLYRIIRMRTYGSIERLYSSLMVYDQDGIAIKQRNDQHKAFLFVALTETAVFSVFILRNRYYLIPAGYSLLHLTWTHIAKQKEVLKKGLVGSELKPVCFSSMDGEIRF
jgi:hypothetical protein